MNQQRLLAGLGSQDALRSSLEVDIREELQAHLEMATAEGVDRGLSPSQARGAALERFGDLEKTVRDCSRQKLGGLMMSKRMVLGATLILIVTVGLLANLAATRNQALVMEREMALQRMEAALLIPQEIIVRIGDSIELVDFYHPNDITGTFVVDRDGTALIPALGHVPVEGLTRAELEVRLRELYQPYYELIDLYVRVHAPQ